MPIEQTDDGKVIISTANGATSATVLLYGATVLSWKAQGSEQLWLSESAKLDGSKAVRGGIPLVFPVFGPPPADLKAKGFVQHGFARTSTWEFLGLKSEDEKHIEVQFGLGPETVEPEALKLAWPFDFTLVYTLALDSEANTLQTSISIENPDSGLKSQAWQFQWLFHTYFKVPEVQNVGVTGLVGIQVADKVSKSEYSEKDDLVLISEEVDRVYKDVPATSIPLQIVSTSPSEQAAKTASTPALFSVVRQNLDDVVVWNPWTENANALSDFTPKSGFHQMLCVEAGTVGKFVDLAPGQKWEASQTLTAHL